MLGPDGKDRLGANLSTSLSLRPRRRLEIGNLLDHSSGLATSPGPRRCSRTDGLGDSTFFGYFVPPNEDGALIWGFGPALQAPTNTDSDLGVDKWAAGPALIVGAQPGNWSLWALFDNVWSFAGSDSEDINLFNFQYQVVYLFPQYPGLVFHQ